ncbi:MAG: hypothetical protein JO033_24595, partial [Acidobacteriaceae bacterium]|nr:hypothetical protein [Acidobacteriaceae bacterium]
MPGIKKFLTAFVVASIGLAAGSVRDAGIADFNEGRYSDALAKLSVAAKDPTDRIA